MPPWVETEVTDPSFFTQGKKDKKGKEIQAILPARMSTKIMVELHKNYKNPTRKDFDQAIAKLFDNASPMVAKLARDGKKPTSDFDYWQVPKVGTIFENVSDRSTCRFAMKMLEGRDEWAELESKRTRENPSYIGYQWDGEAAKAIDRFNSWVEAANFMSDSIQALQSGTLPETFDFNMKAYLAEQFDPESDTEGSEDSIDDEEESSIDEAPAAKRVKLEISPATDGQTHAYSALVAGTAPLTFRVREPKFLDGANKNDVGDTIDYGPFLEQMAKEDAAQLDDEDLMMLEGN